MSSRQNCILVRQVGEALLRSEERFRLLVEGVRDYAASALANGTPSGSDRGGGQRI